MVEKRDDVDEKGRLSLHSLARLLLRSMRNCLRFRDMLSLLPPLTYFLNNTSCFSLVEEQVVLLFFSSYFSSICFGTGMYL